MSAGLGTARPLAAIAKQPRLSPGTLSRRSLFAADPEKRQAGYSERANHDSLNTWLIRAGRKITHGMKGGGRTKCASAQSYVTSSAPIRLQLTKGCSMTGEELAHKTSATNWAGLVKFHDRYATSPTKGRWIFRGHSRADWDLRSGLERAIARFDMGGRTVAELEGGLVRQFARRAHHYLADAPKRDSWVEWLALMQHHGAPTRLLDFTYSFYVALFFALEDMEPEEPCAVWALDLDWTGEQLKRIVGDNWFSVIYDGDDRNIENRTTFKEFFASGRKMVFAINPYRLNQRLSIQQGIFLTPGEVSGSFLENLAAMGHGASSASGSLEGSLVKCEIQLSKADYQDCIQRLIRMNMTRTSLFPGLDGFARSQSLAFANPHTLVRDPLYPIWP